MVSRKPIVIMNWSMRQNILSEAQTYAKKIMAYGGEGIDIVILPSMGVIHAVSEILTDKRFNTSIQFGSQNMAEVEYGELNGEFSIQSLIDMGGEYVELGHWERRKLFNETDKTVNNKMKLALKKQISPIICVGEIEKGEANNVIDEIKNPNYEEELEETLFLQLFNIFFPADELTPEKIIIAYTPAWAVGETKAASIQHIKKATSMIRRSLQKIFGESAKTVRVIYGGTVSLENTATMMQATGIDGVLVGRFGSKPERYGRIIDIVKESVRSVDN